MRNTNTPIFNKKPFFSTKLMYKHLFCHFVFDKHFVWCYHLLMEFKRKRTIYEIFFKRPLDIVLSFIAIVILSPLFLIVSLLSLIILKGNPFFCQNRPGKNGKIFKLYKFRSMTNKKDANGNLLPDKDRITKYGKILRKLSIDELPQLFNILKGDMSIVGPRPRLIKDMIFYDEYVFVAYSVKPGLTGKSQVSGGRSECSWEAIFQSDLSYVKKITFFGDIKILFQTVISLFKSDASSGGAGNENKREYYYADYLLKQNKITKEQYDSGIQKSSELMEDDLVEYTENLH